MHNSLVATESGFYQGISHMKFKSKAIDYISYS